MDLISKIELVKLDIYNDFKTVYAIKVYCTESYFDSFVNSVDVKNFFTYFKETLNDPYNSNSKIPENVKWIQYNGVVFRVVKDVPEDAGVMSVSINGTFAPKYIGRFNKEDTDSPVISGIPHLINFFDTTLEIVSLK